MSYYSDDQTTAKKIIEYGAGVAFGFTVLILCTGYLIKQNLKYSISKDTSY